MQSAGPHPDLQNFHLVLTRFRVTCEKRDACQELAKFRVIFFQGDLLMLFL